MTPHIPSAHEVETFSGRYVDTENPSAEDIVLEDVAHALSQVCRYGGHCQRFYSVAEHAVIVSRRLEHLGLSRRWQMAGLHHDDAEAFLGDIPRPMKSLLGEAYATLTERMDVAVVWGLGLNDGSRSAISAADFHDPYVKDADNWALFLEARHLLPSRGLHWWNGAQGASEWGLPDKPSRIVVPGYWTGGVSPSIAKQLYLARHNELKEAT